MAPRQRGARRRGRGNRRQRSGTMFHTYHTTTLSSGEEYKLTASLFKFPPDCTFIAQSVTITVSSKTAPMIFQLELYNESGYLAKVFPPFMNSDSALPTTRTYRWPKGVEHVNGSTAATNVFGVIRTPCQTAGGALSAVLLVKLACLMSSNTLTIFCADDMMQHCGQPGTSKGVTSGNDDKDDVISLLSCDSTSPLG